MTRRTKQDAAPDETRQQMDALIEQAKTTRLNMEEERRATELLRSLIAGGRAGLAASVPAALALPWLVGVTAFSEEWQALSATARRSVVTGLEKEDPVENSRRFRLSLARGIFPTDPATTEKIITGVVGAMTAEGEPSAKDRQTFANVLLGKSKPWIARAPVKDWKAAKKVAAMAAFAIVGSPAFAQPGIIRWLHEAGLLTQLPAPALAALAGEMRRWKNQQRKELGMPAEELPAELAEAVASASQQVPDRPAPQKNAPAQPRPQPPQKPRHQEEQRPRQKQVPQAGGQSDERPAFQPRQEIQTQQVTGQADVPRLLRQIDQEFARLRHELSQTRSQPKARGRQTRHETDITAVEPEELETLRRCNAQLEERITDLRSQLDDLATHHEDHATTRLNGTEAEQFRSLLSLKLQEDYEMYVGLRNEAANEVVRRTLTDVLAHIFDVLRGEGVAFSEPAARS